VIESTIFHELGHDCIEDRQLGQAMCKRNEPHLTAENLGSLVKMTHAGPSGKKGADCDQRSAVMSAIMNDRLGPVTSACINNGLLAAAADPGTNSTSHQPMKPKSFCQGDWKEEALASALTYPLRTRLSHWTMECAGASLDHPDQTHGPSNVWIDCIVKRPDMQQVFCPTR
jgi:hypothetical protein